MPELERGSTWRMTIPGIAVGVFLAVTGLFILSVPALAGPNAGGVLVVHYNASQRVPPNPEFVEGGLHDCTQVVTQAPAGANPILWYVYAAFPPNASPRLKVVTFGCQFNQDQVGVLWSATRPGALQIFYPDQASWPSTGSGVAVGFETTLFQAVDEVYCFAGYGYQAQTFRVRPHPDHGIGGTFADDAVPAHLDEVAGYGYLGFGVLGSDPDTLCAAVAPAGACCRGADGTCVIVPASNCDPYAGDFYLGNDTVCPGPSCTDFTGACCTVMINGGCEIRSFGDCQQTGGLFCGIGVSCQPSPCPQQLGACCNGTACRVTTWEDCPASQGEWIYQAPCTPGFCLGGACCNPNTGVCYLELYLECMEQENTWLGGSCDPNPCPQPAVCCDPETGSCYYPMSEMQCDEVGGIFHPELHSCVPNPCEAEPGSCCLVMVNGACEFLTREQCSGRGGLWGGLESECQPETCPPDLGACCRWGYSCIVTLEAECDDIGGTQWTALQPCTPDLCAERHACCTVWIDGECALVTRNQCDEHGGLFFPGVNSCDPDQNPCLADDTFHLGACCIGSRCGIMTQERCNQVEGTWQQNIPCTPGRCSPTFTGACCYVQPAGQCQVVTSAQCSDAGALFLGDATTCDPNPCPSGLGACCILSQVPGGLCMVMIQEECLPPHHWMGEEPCLPSTCALSAAGACCLSNGECVQSTEPECAAAHGTYRGDHIPCVPNPCAPTRIETTSWGRIKTMYR